MSAKIIYHSKELTDSSRFLHTPSKFAKEHLLFVQEVGTLRSLQPHLSRREELDSFLFLIVTEGTGIIRTDNQKCSVKKGDCVFLDCSKNYEHISSVDNPWTLVWVHFHGEIAPKLHQLFLEKNESSVLYKPSNVERIVQLIQDIMMLGHDYEIIDELKASYYLMNLITDAIEDVSEGVQMEDVREYIGEHYREENLLENIAAQFQITHDDLIQQFYQNYGIDIRDYVMNRRFIVAKELLRFTIKDIETVIDESGIRNEDLFRQLFRDKEGMTAEEYRKKWAQWIKD